ncbi:MAG: hypothetical protein ACE5DI_03995 [Candidatus Micrarchaeia archaeon]
MKKNVLPELKISLGKEEKARYAFLRAKATETALFPPSQVPSKLSLLFASNNERGLDEEIDFLRSKTNVGNDLADYNYLIMQQLLKHVDSLEESLDFLIEVLESGNKVGAPASQAGGIKSVENAHCRFCGEKRNQFYLKQHEQFCSKNPNRTQSGGRPKNVSKKDEKAKASRNSGKKTKGKR